MASHGRSRARLPLLLGVTVAAAGACLLARSARSDEGPKCAAPRAVGSVVDWRGILLGDFAVGATAIDPQARCVVPGCPQCGQPLALPAIAPWMCAAPPLGERVWTRGEALVEDLPPGDSPAEECCASDDHCPNCPAEHGQCDSQLAEKPPAARRADGPAKRSRIRLRAGEAAAEIVELKRKLRFDPMRGTIFGRPAERVAQPAGHCEGSALEFADEDDDAEATLAAAIRRLETSDEQTAGDMPALGQWIADGSPDMGGAAGLRAAEQKLAEAAELLEAARDYQLADRIRDLAQDVRWEARRKESPAASNLNKASRRDMRLGPVYSIWVDRVFPSPSHRFGFDGMTYGVDYPSHPARR